MKPLKRNLALIAIVSIVGAWYGVYRYAGSRLLARAEYVTDTSTWDLETTRNDDYSFLWFPLQTSYSWISDSEVFYVRSNANRPKRKRHLYLQAGFRFPAAPGSVIASYSLRDHRERTYDNLTAEFLRSGGATDTLSISEDRRRALWYGPGPRKSRPDAIHPWNYDIAHSANIDGSNHVRWSNHHYPESAEFDVHTLVSAHRMIDIENETNHFDSATYDPFDPKRELPAEHETEEYSKLAYARGRGAGEAISTNWLWRGQGQQRPLQSRVEELSGGARTVYTYPIKLPENYELLDNVFSPHGDRVLWLLTVRYVPAIRALLHKYIRAVRADPTYADALWSSRVDGTGMHEVGSVDAPHPDDVPELFYIRWLPDNKMISFVYHNSLYVVAVD